jgi:alpha-tubulin suppressor-like RCC1 family protein
MTCVSYTSTFQVSNKLNESETNYEKGGTVYVWGDDTNGGATTFLGSPGQIPDLQNVVQIYATDVAFAALLQDTSVYMWGRQSSGSSTSIQGYLTINNEKVFGIKTIRNTSEAFTAITNDGFVIVWGSTDLGGSSTPSTAPDPLYSPLAIVPELLNITKIYSTYGAFSAVDIQGQVWTWGDPQFGALGNGDIQQITGLQNVVEITCNNSAFAALLQDGTVYVWGSGGSGGFIGPGPGQDIIGVVVGLSNVKKVYATEGAFSALRNDGSVFIWGDVSGGGSMNGVNSYVNLPISGATTIYSNEGAFVAQLDGQVYVWGSPICGGNITYNGGYNPSYIPGIKNVCSTDEAFAGLTIDNHIFVWGEPIYGGSTVYNDPLQYGIILISNNIVSIVGASSSFSALNESGQVIRWGDYLNGGGGTNGNPEFVPGLNNIQQIFANNLSFGVVDNNNKVSVWGNALSGGDNSQVEGLTNFGAVFPSYDGGAYAVLQLEPEPVPPTPEDSTFNPVLAGFIGALIGIFIFVSFYFISNIKTDSFRYASFLAVILIATGVVIAVSLAT